MTKIKVLFIYKGMVMGGSTTSLLSVLRELDYSTYEVDLLLFQIENPELFEEIPKEVNILPFAYKSSLPLKLRKMLSIKCWKALMSKNEGRYKEQMMQQALVSLSRNLNKKYDIAASYLEGWSLYYLVDKVKAKRKISWIHVNYGEAGYNREADFKYFEKIDEFALVSDSCVNDFVDRFSRLDVKAVNIPNLLSAKVLRNRADISIKDITFPTDSNILKFISVCRLDCKHKGLDRAVRAFAKLKEYRNRYVWYIVGEGDDREYLEKLIESEGLSSNIYMIGSKSNPCPYVYNSDVFLLPSHYEGKPMAVTEAQILGVVPCVTDYSSAREQIADGIDGIVMDNTDEGIEEALRDILSGKVDLKQLKCAVDQKDYSNAEEIKVVERFMRGYNGE